MEKNGIQVTCNGNHKVIDLTIPDELTQPDKKEELEDLLLIALNEALSKADEESGKNMKGMADDLIPGGLDGLF